MANDTAPLTWEEYNESGRRLFAAGDLAGADEAFTAAIAEAERGTANPLHLASSLSSLAQLKYQQKDALRAEELFRRALTLREEALGPDDKSVITSINNLAALYVSRGALDDAEPLLKRAMTASVKRVESSQGDLAINLNNLARLYFKRGDYVQAEPLLLRLLTLKRPMGPEHPEVATVLVSLAKVRQALGKNDAAERVWRRVLAVRERTMAATDPAVLLALDGLADTLAAQGKLAPACELRDRALNARIATLGGEHAIVAAGRTKLEETRAALAASTSSTTIPMRVKRPVTLETNGSSGLTPPTDRAPIELDTGPIVVATPTTRRSSAVPAITSVPEATESADTGFGGRIAAAAGNRVSNGVGIPAARRQSTEVKRATTPAPNATPAVDWIEPESKPGRTSRTSTRKRVLNFGNVIGGGESGGGGGRTLTIALGVFAVVGCLAVGGIVFGPSVLAQLHSTARPVAVLPTPHPAPPPPAPPVDSTPARSPVAVAPTPVAPTPVAPTPAPVTLAAKPAPVATRPAAGPAVPANGFASHMGSAPTVDAPAPDQDQLPPPPSVDIDNNKKP
ncbi:MAG TPA: tetratricopeptide repeat protein [Gemmatimonadaceae bacterium]|jgi:tetratricopeptide (TPR) repeat protein|nr:tetratricopeptide repeat protein [Gemmatimonadaceae bacterium]